MATVDNVQQVAEAGGDEAFLVAAQLGDHESFERLMEPNIGLGYRLAASMLGDKGLAEDAVQDATLRAWRKINQVRSGAMVRSWFLAIVANRCRSARTGRWWFVIRLGEIAFRTSNPADAVDRHEDLVRALRRLNADERAAVFLRFYEDMSSLEVGAALGISAAAARSRIHRALRRLRVDLAQEEL